MKRPWMPLYVRDYLADTGHLSTVQHGAYCLLIMTYWVQGGLPDDDEQLAQITGLPVPIWLLHRAVLQRFFHRGWKHHRLDAEIARTMDKIAKRTAAGSKGGTVTSMRRMQKRRG